MDNNDRENDLQNNVPEENTGKEQTEAPQETPAENNDSAKAFWKETPYDEMQHVKPDSFAGISTVDFIQKIVVGGISHYYPPLSLPTLRMRGAFALRYGLLP